MEADQQVEGLTDGWLLHLVTQSSRAGNILVLKVEHPTALFTQGTLL